MGLLLKLPRKSLPVRESDFRSFLPCGWSQFGWILSLAVLLLGIASALPDRNSLTTFHETNASVRLYQTRAIVERRELHVRGILCRSGPRHDSLDLSLGPTGLPYPNKAPGSVWAAVPAYAGLYAAGMTTSHHRSLRFLALLLSCLPMLAAAWALGLRLRPAVGREAAGVAVFALLAASALFTYMGLFQDYALGTALLTAGWIALERRGASGLTALVGGAALGLAAAVNYAFLVYGAVLALAALWARRARGEPVGRWCAAALFGALPFALGVLWYHHAAFGDAFTTPYAHLRSALLRARTAQAHFSVEALLAALFSPKSGWFWQSFWALAGLWGLGLVWRQRPTLGPPSANTASLDRSWAVAGLGVAVSAWGFFGFWHSSQPDDAPFNRHLIPALPLCAAGLAVVWRRLQTARCGAALQAALVATLLIDFIHQWVTSWSFPYHEQDVIGALWSVDWPLFMAGAHVRPISWGELGITAPPHPSWGAAALSAGLALFAFLALAWSSHETASRAGAALATRGRGARALSMAAGLAAGVAYLLGGFLVGVSDSDAPRQVALEQRALDNASALVLESHHVPTGAGWREQGWPDNRWCRQEASEGGESARGAEEVSK